MRRAKLYTYQGKTLPLTEWARRAGIGRQTLRQRLYIGWDFGRAVSTPNMNYKYEYRGRKYTLEELTVMNGTLSKDGMSGRLRKMSVEDAVNTPNMKHRRSMFSPCRLDCFQCPYPDCTKK